MFLKFELPREAENRICVNIIPLKAGVAVIDLPLCSSSKLHEYFQDTVNQGCLLTTLEFVYQFPIIMLVLDAASREERPQFVCCCDSGHDNLILLFMTFSKEYYACC